MKEFEYSGLWWVPHDPERRVPGSLIFTHNDGPLLKLMGILSPRPSASAAVDLTQPVILGVTQHGQHITLDDCSCSHWTTLAIQPFHVDSMHYLPNRAFIGGHFPALEAMEFYRVAVQFSYLPDWLGIRGFEPKETNEEIEDPSIYEFVYIPPKVAKICIPEGTVAITHNFHPKHTLAQIASPDEAVWVEIEPKEETSFESIWKTFIYPLCNFFTLATQQPNSILNVRAYSKHMDYAPNIDDPFFHEVEVAFPFPYHRERAGETLSKSHMFFTLEDVADEIETILAAWLTLSSKLDEILNLFFSVQYNRTMYLANIFLNVIQAIESFHRLQRKNEVLTPQEHHVRLQIVKAVVPKKIQPWLFERLQHSNEPTLKARLVEMIESTSEIMLPLIEDGNEFANHVRDTRNYHTHYDSSLKNKAAQDTELYLMTRNLFHLMYACLLGELGFTPQRCAEFHQRNFQYKQEARQVSNKGR